MELRQHAVTACDGRGGALKGVDLLRRPRVPRLQSLRRQLQRKRMRMKRAPYRLACLPHLGFSACAACVGHVVLPLAPWQPQLPGPCPPGGGEGRLLPILLDAFPPKIPPGRQRRHLVSAFLQGGVPGW
jgi:hypothetical protein